MPPRAAKKAAGSSGSKKAPARGARSAQKKQIPPEEPEEKIEQAPDPVVVEVKEEIKVEETVVEEINVEEIVPQEHGEKPSEPKSEANGSLSVKGNIFIALFEKCMFRILVCVCFEGFEHFSIKKVNLGCPQTRPDWKIAELGVSFFSF